MDKISTMECDVFNYTRSAIYQAQLNHCQRVIINNKFNTKMRFYKNCDELV